MNKNIVFLVLGVCFIVAGAGITYYLFFRQTDEKISYVPSSQNSTYPANTSQNTQQQSPSLQVQGVNDVALPKQNQLPLPDSFEVYEQYTNDTSSLYIDVVVGTGVEAVRGDNVAMLYKGWLTNGEMFDQSRKNEQGQLEPFVFQLGAGQVIQGWEQTIAGMKEGGKRRLIIPSAVGYGPAGQGPIPPNALLVFDVELIGVQKPQ